MITREEAQDLMTHLYPVMSNGTIKRKATRDGIESLSSGELRQLQKDIGREILDLNRRMSDLHLLHDYVFDRLMGLRFG